MAATKAALATGYSATATAAGATTTGTVMVLTSVYRAGAIASVTTTTAPTSTGTVTLYGSVDGITYLVADTRSIGLAASTVYAFQFDFPDWVQNARIDVNAGTGTGVTTTAIAGDISGI